jgi:hypothetical protein
LVVVSSAVVVKSSVVVVSSVVVPSVVVPSVVTVGGGSVLGRAISPAGTRAVAGGASELPDAR